MSVDITRSPYRQSGNVAKQRRPVDFEVRSVIQEKNQQRRRTVFAYSERWDELDQRVIAV